MSEITDRLPAAFLERLARVVPAEHLAAARASFALDKPLCARLNPLRAPGDEAYAALVSLGFSLVPLALAPDCFMIDVPPERRREVTDAAVVRTGGAYLQNPSSLLPALALAPRGGEKVLDLCAAPGGKTLHLRALMARSGETGGELAAVEAVRDRFFRLRAQLETFGASDVRTFLKDGRSVGYAVPEKFDRALVDAPCSSEARFDARDATTFAHWSDAKIHAMAEKQRALLRSAIDATRVGGTIVYSTCSLATEENEDIVAAVLAGLPEGAEVVTVPHGLDPAALPAHTSGVTPSGVHMLRILPGPAWDAFFLVRLEKRSATGTFPDSNRREERGSRADDARRPKKPGASGSRRR